MIHIKRLKYLPLLLAVLVLLSGCSTTRRVPDGEIRYQGIEKIKFDMPKSEKLGEGVEDNITQSVKVNANNTIFGFIPIPFGLWVYNNWYTPGNKGLKGWLYKKWAKDPVLVSDVRPDTRTLVIDQILDNNGYFRGSASYELVQGKNRKKATILYTVKPGPAYPLSSVEFLPDRMSSLPHYRLRS